MLLVCLYLYAEFDQDKAGDKYGSRASCEGEVSSQTTFFTMEKLEWFIPTMSGTRPPALAAHGSAVLGACLYIFGGWSPSEIGPVAQDTLYCLHTGEL